jgi:hypothetical protein
MAHEPANHYNHHKHSLDRNDIVHPELLAMKCRAKPNAEEQSVTQDAWSSGVRGVYHRLARKPSEQRVSTTALHATHRHV